MSNPFRYFNSSPEVIRLVVMLYVKYPLSLRNVEDLLAERGIDISHETVRLWWNRFGPMFAAEIRKRRVAHMRRYPQWQWHLDEVFVKVNGKLCYLRLSTACGLRLRRVGCYAPRSRLLDGRDPGGVAERPKAHAWKVCIRETVSRVRIPPPPPRRPEQTGSDPGPSL